MSTAITLSPNPKPVLNLDALRGVSPQSVTDEYVSGQSLQRFVEPDEVAAMCRFLASPAASMISGQAIAVDGNTETL